MGYKHLTRVASLKLLVKTDIQHFITAWSPAETEQGYRDWQDTSTLSPMERYFSLSSELQGYSTSSAPCILAPVSTHLTAYPPLFKCSETTDHTITVKLLQYKCLPFQFPSLPNKDQRTDHSFHYQMEKKASLRQKFSLVVFPIKSAGSIKKDPKTKQNFISNSHKNQMWRAQKDISNNSSSDVTVIIAPIKAHWSAWTASLTREWSLTKTGKATVQAESHICDNTALITSKSSPWLNNAFSSSKTLEVTWQQTSVQENYLFVQVL